MKHILLRSLIDTQQLAGRELGKQHLPILMGAALDAREGELILWDFSGITHASASYFAATFLNLITTAEQLDRYFAFFELNRPTTEDFDIVLKTEKLAALVASRIQDDRITEVKVLGHLDPAYEQTFWEVCRLGEATSEDVLRSANRAVTIKKTAWINRLTYLHRQRLLRKEKRDREFVFKPAYL
jgi:hypothetical protein